MIIYNEYLIENTLSLNIQKASTHISPELLSHFQKFFFQDSTQFTLHEKLALQFKGSAGSGSKATGKIDVVYELKSQKFT